MICAWSAGSIEPYSCHTLLPAEPLGFEVDYVCVKPIAAEAAATGD